MSSQSVNVTQSAHRSKTPPISCWAITHAENSCCLTLRSTSKLILTHRPPTNICLDQRCTYSSTRAKPGPRQVAKWPAESNGNVYHMKGMAHRSLKSSSTRNQLTDAHLEAVLRLSATSIKSNISRLVVGDDWWPGLLRRCSARLEQLVIQRHRHTAPSGTGWRHIFSRFPLPNSAHWIYAAQFFL